MSKGFVGLGHLEDVVLLFDSGTGALEGFDDFVSQSFGQRGSFFVAGGIEYPAKSQGCLTLRGHLDGYLVDGATNPLTFDLQYGGDVSHSSFKSFQGLVVAFGRAVLVSSLFIAFLHISHNKYFQKTAKSSLVGSKLTKIAPHIYESVYLGFVKKYFPTERLNDDAFALVPHEKS